MRQLLLISLVAALAAVGAVAYQLMPRGRAVPEPAREQARPADPVRSIPLRPRDAATATPAPPPDGGTAKASDVLGDVSRTLDELRTRDGAEAGGGGTTLTAAQVDALKAQAERRHVRPVTRMTFALEPGTSVPPQVYLHPLPPELAGLSQAGDPLGFIQVGDRFLLVGTVSRRIVSVSKG